MIVLVLLMVLAAGVAGVVVTIDGFGSIIGFGV